MAPKKIVHSPITFSFTRIEEGDLSHKRQECLKNLWVDKETKPGTFCEQLRFLIRCLMRLLRFLTLLTWCLTLFTCFKTFYLGFSCFCTDFNKVFINFWGFHTSFTYFLRFNNDFVVFGWVFKVFKVRNRVLMGSSL